MARREAINEVRPVLEDIDKVTGVVDKGLDKAEQGVDVAAEAVENATHAVIEEAHQAVAWFRNPKIAVGALIIATGVSAGFLGWHIAKRHFNKKFENELAMEIESARKFYGRLNKVDADGAVLTPEVLVEQNAKDAAEALKEYQDGPTQYNKVAPKVVVDETDGTLRTESVIESNIFQNGQAVVPDNFDLVEESRNREPDRPYVISSEEFMANEPEFVQNTLTYYAGDDILADDRDEVVDNVEQLVGTENLARFGHGSGDPNIVYIRNERNEADFEIAYSGGKYAEEVHGFIAHSAQPLRKHKKHGGRG